MATTVIRDASLVDGTGAPQRPADIVINEGRIVEITPALKASTSHASRVINADSMLVAHQPIQVQQASSLHRV